jgi:adenosylcobinamide-phosphate synthase
MNRRPLLCRGFGATGCAQAPYEGSSATGRVQIRFGVAAAAGLVADRMLGEPPAAAHPVALFGRAMTQLERLVWRDSRSAGAGYVAIGIGLGSLAGAGFVRAADAALRRTAGTDSGRTAHAARGRGVGLAVGSSIPAGAVATWLVVAGRALGEEARAIGERLVVDDLEGARRRLPALVGRDPESLDAKGVARAVVESVAENTVDAVVAPACWAALGGATGAGFYRAANTLDAMVGHRNDRYRQFGWAAARLDDAANWIPARLTALLVAAVRPARARDVLEALVHPPAHPSPNAGVAEAAFAAALGLRLGGDTIYAGRVDPRPTFGTGRPPEAPDIEASVRLSRDVTFALAALLAAPALLGAVARRRLGSTPLSERDRLRSDPSRGAQRNRLRWDRAEVGGAEDGAPKAGPT